jgi:hypothetical protein
MVKRPPLVGPFGPAKKKAARAGGLILILSRFA